MGASAATELGWNREFGQFEKRFFVKLTSVVSYRHLQTTSLPIRQQALTSRKNFWIVSVSDCVCRHHNPVSLRPSFSFFHPPTRLSPLLFCVGGMTLTTSVGDRLLKFDFKVSADLDWVFDLGPVAGI